MRVIVTGGAGFIGSQVVRELISRNHYPVVIDSLTYAGTLDNLHNCKCDIRVDDINRVHLEACDAVLHLAAESHVQRSFGDAQQFLKSNVAGTESILSQCVRLGVKNVVHVSTDEVFGSVPEGEWRHPSSRLAPRNPYAASKAAAEMIVSSYREWQRLPVKMVRLSNCYGPRQHVEKLVPRVICRALVGVPIELHGGGKQVRDWLHVSDAARGIVDVMERGAPGETYHLAGGNERSVARVVDEILALMESTVWVREVEDRPGGNDIRYGMAAAGLLWTPAVPFLAGLKSTVEWYVANQDRVLEAA